VAPTGTFAPFRMIRFPHAKINLGLNVVRKRGDGYHDIESVLVPIPLRDVLEVVIDPSLRSGELVFTRSGLPVPGEVETDLCWRAVKAVGQEHALPGLRMHLHKVIPMGAGLGGGSSDGTHALLLLNDLLDLGLPYAQSRAYAASLGSDCPFFLRPVAQLAEGRGERLAPVELDLKGLWLVLVDPGVHVPTSEVYGNLKPSGTSVDLRKLISLPIEQWPGRIINTMEPYVFATRPAVAQVKEKLLAAGAAYTAMSGSGSVVFGLFRSMPPALTWPSDHRSWAFRL
jgi:4-diphosphocytidyl-2-C-methyl-D-erythritol kinase